MFVFNSMVQRKAQLNEPSNSMLVASIISPFALCKLWMACSLVNPMCINCSIASGFATNGIGAKLLGTVWLRCCIVGWRCLAFSEGGGMAVGRVLFGGGDFRSGSMNLRQKLLTIVGVCNRVSFNASELYTTPLTIPARADKNEDGKFDNNNLTFSKIRQIKPEIPSNKRTICR